MWSSMNRRELQLEQSCVSYNNCCARCKDTLHVSVLVAAATHHETTLLWLLRLLVTVRICTWLLLDGRLFYQRGLVQQIAKASLATCKQNSGKPQLIYHVWIWLSFPPQHVLPLCSSTINQLWFSTVQLACCKTFAICCKPWQPKGDTQRQSHNSGPLPSNSGYTPDWPQQKKVRVPQGLGYHESLYNTDSVLIFVLLAIAGKLQLCS